jgi:hypothetical protein
MAGEVPDGSQVQLTADEQGIVFEVTSQPKETDVALEAV